MPEFPGVKYLAFGIIPKPLSGRSVPRHCIGNVVDIMCRAGEEGEGRV